jgi:hypothetical protein
LEDLDINWRIILKWILMKQDEGVDCIHVVEDRVQWRAFVNVVMNEVACLLGCCAVQYDVLTDVSRERTASIVRLYGATSQKTAIFTLIAVRT